MVPRYHPGMSDALVAGLERASARVGLSRTKTRLLGQDPATAKGFVEATFQGEERSYLQRVDWEMLQDRMDRDGGPVREAIRGLPVSRSSGTASDDR